MGKLFQDCCLDRIAMRIILLLVLVSNAAFAEDCPISGEAKHWAIDYCLLINESDDFSQPGVQECYQTEQKQITGKNECKAREYYKHKICEAHAYYEDGFSVEDCFADVEFRGPTVGNGGVVKPIIKSYLP
jgi:hypothetical protein